MTIKHLLGIEKQIVDESTGVPTNFHVVSNIDLDFTYHYYTVTVGEYYSREAYLSGKSSVGSQKLQINNPPAKGQCAIEWALTALVESEGTFNGGQLVYDERQPTSEPEQ